MACFQKLPQGPYRRPEGVELADRQALLVVGASEVRKLLQQFFNNLGPHRFIHSRSYADVARIKTDLPLVGGRDDHVASDKLAPLHMIAKGGREQPEAVPALTIDAIRFLEYSHAGPLKIARIEGDVALLCDHLQPVIEPPAHDGAD